MSKCEISNKTKSSLWRNTLLNFLPSLISAEAKVRAVWSRHLSQMSGSVFKGRPFPFLCKQKSCIKKNRCICGAFPQKSGCQVRAQSRADYLKTLNAFPLMDFFMSRVPTSTPDNQSEIFAGEDLVQKPEPKLNEAKWPILRDRKLELNHYKKLLLKVWARWSDTSITLWLKKTLFIRTENKHLLN